MVSTRASQRHARCDDPHSCWFWWQCTAARGCFFLLSSTHREFTMHPLIAGLKGSSSFQPSHPGSPCATPETKWLRLRVPPNGGAAAIRCQGTVGYSRSRDVNVPVIGLWKGTKASRCVTRACVMAPCRYRGPDARERPALDGRSLLKTVAALV